MPDELSRRPKSEDKENNSYFDEEEEWTKPHQGLELRHNNIIRLAGLKLPSKQQGCWKRLVEYLNKFKRPSGSKEEDFKKLKGINQISFWRKANSKEEIHQIHN
ncbi:hypothetical protein O181_115905 [Austropuccinia psidii MF-1]|uniref:Uncharacterized protein n=1 Tax=Austropuccinia psidii MF-1 TaxID=1389203 RepID=A0A9Q3KBC7_9BASI|nr:hypothetical protein [Austropuccinia psidii MF-1]